MAVENGSATPAAHADAESQPGVADQHDGSEAGAAASHAIATNGSVKTPATTQTNGSGSGSVSSYSVPRASARIFQEAMLENPLIASQLPPEAAACSKTVSFEGTPAPSIPIPWRFAESISSLKALAATMINVLLQRKYDVAPQKVVINTDHAQLFIMSTVLYAVDPEGTNSNNPGPIPVGAAAGPMKDAFEKYFPSYDFKRAAGSFHRASATNIYRCKDGRYFHIHGSMDPDATLTSLGLPLDRDVATEEESWKPFEDKVSQLDSAELQRLASDVYRQAGTICWSKEEFAQSEHGRANAGVGLYEIHAVPPTTLGAQKPGWWPDSPHTSVRRPLAGLKVLDLTRIIAAPAVTRELAELGASVLRITAKHLTDMHILHPDLNWGKWNAHLDFREEEDREKLRELVREADVVVQGYRPGVLDKYGFSMDGLLELCKDRDRGLIVVRENCYGWNGPWAYRSGWQQISDACCGVSLEYGRAMGHGEPVTPVFPNSDYCTGVCGVVGILDALMRRAQDGGSYKVDVALNYYSFWLTRFVGTYPPEAWEALWGKHGKPVFHAHHNMGYTLPRMIGLLMKNTPQLFNPAFFENRESKAIGTKIRTVKPVLRFEGDHGVELGFNVGARGNGVDAAKWPSDLMTEVVV